MLNQGETAATFVLETPSGRPVDLAAAREFGPVLLAFYKTGCPTCQLSFPFLQKLHQAYGRKGLLVLGVSQDDGETTVQFSREHGCTFDSVLDADDYSLSLQYGIETVPVLFLVGQDGLVWKVQEGWARDEWNELSSFIARMLKAETVLVSADGDGAPAWKPG